MKGHVRRSAFSVVVVALALGTTGCWRVGNLDGPGTGVLAGRTGDAVNADKSAAIVSVGAFRVPVIAYFDSTSNRLRFGVDRPDIGWQFSDLDGPGVPGGGGRTSADVGTFNSTSLGIGPLLGGGLDVYYFDSTNLRLRHAHNDGGPGPSAWTFEDLDGPGVPGASGRTGDPAGAFNASAFFGGQPNDLYRAEHTDKLKQITTTRLRHFWFDGQYHFEDVDGPGSTFTGHTEDDVGSYTAAQVYNGALHAFYYDLTAHTLRHATYSGSTWTFETLDGAGGGSGRVSDDVGQYNATATTPDGHLHVFYLDATTHRLRHANFNGSTWSFENLDGPGVAGGAGRTANMVGAYAAAALNAPGNVIDVLYSNDTTHSLRHARFDGSTWTFETIDGTGALTIGATTDQVGQYNAAGYGGNPVELLMWTGDTTSGNLRSGCTLGPATTPPATCS